jgi:hypothetical protein
MEFCFPMRRLMTTTLAADVTAAGLVASILESGGTIVSTEISAARLAYRQGWGMYWTTDWEIRWRDALGSATLTTIEREGDEATEVSRAVELLAAMTDSR